MYIVRTRALASVVVIAALFALAGVGDTAGAAPRAGSAENPVFYTDPAGDSNGGPDISRVQIANTAAGVISFDISIPNAGALLADDAVVVVVIDADRSDSTGTDGFEYSIQSWGSLGQPYLTHWDGLKMVEIPALSLIKSWTSGGTMSFQIARSDLNHTSGFYAYVATWTKPAPPAGGGWSDEAPDGADVFDYVLSMPHATRGLPHFSPAWPRAGRKFAVTGVTFDLATNENVPATGFRCRATLAGKPLRGSRAGSCTFTLQRDAKKKRLAVTTTATVGDESWTLRKSFVVR